MDYIRGPESPPQSLGLRLTAMVGRNQVQKQLGNFGALYTVTASNVQEMYFELKTEFPSWSSNPSEVVTQLVLSTSGPIKLRATQMDDTEIVLTINKMLVLDTPLKSFTVVNESDVTVRGTLNYVTQMAQP